MATAVAETPSKGDRALRRAVELSAELDRSRRRETKLLDDRAKAWREANRAGVTQAAIAAACGVSIDSVYQAIRAANGNPVRRRGKFGLNG